MARVAYPFGVAPRVGAEFHRALVALVVLSARGNRARGRWQAATHVAIKSVSIRLGSEVGGRKGKWLTEFGCASLHLTSKQISR